MTSSSAVCFCLLLSTKRGWSRLWILRSSWVSLVLYLTKKCLNAQRLPLRCSCREGSLGESIGNTKYFRNNEITWKSLNNRGIQLGSVMFRRYNGPGTWRKKWKKNLLLSLQNHCNIMTNNNNIVETFPDSNKKKIMDCFLENLIWF